MRQINQAIKKSHTSLGENIDDNQMKSLISKFIGTDNEDVDRGCIDPKDLCEEDLSRLVDAIMMKTYGLKNGTISRTTTWRLMKTLGMKYVERRKHYFTDSHEAPPVVKYCKGFTKRYLVRELRMPVWTQISAEEVKKLKEEKKLSDIPNIGCAFQKRDGTQWFEFHVDSSEFFSETCFILSHGKYFLAFMIKIIP